MGVYSKKGMFFFFLLLFFRLSFIGIIFFFVISYIYDTVSYNNSLSLFYIHNVGNVLAADSYVGEYLLIYLGEKNGGCGN